MTERYFEDFKVGDAFEGIGWTLTESAIIDFAAHYDPQPIHIDKEAAASGPYGGLIASGFQTLAMAFRSFYQTGVIAHCSLGASVFEEFKWSAPVRPGDTLRTTAEVIDLRPSASKPDRGVSKWRFTVRNQKGETVLYWVPVIFLKRRAAG